MLQASAFKCVPYIPGTVLVEAHKGQIAMAAHCGKNPVKPLHALTDPSRTMQVRTTYIDVRAQCMHFFTPRKRTAATLNRSRNLNQAKRQSGVPMPTHKTQRSQNLNALHAPRTDRTFCAPNKIFRSENCACIFLYMFGYLVISKDVQTTLSAKRPEPNLFIG